MANKTIITDEAGVRKERKDILLKYKVFRLFLVELMRKARYLKSQGNLDKYTRGKRDAYTSIIEEFVMGADGGAALVAEYIEATKNEGSNECIN